jgi:hypothetical protein
MYIISNLLGLLSDQEDYRLLGCDTMYCDVRLYCRGMLSCILQMETVYSCQTLVPICQATWCRIPPA